MYILQREGVLAGAVLTIPEIMSDPQMRSRNVWTEHSHPDAGTWEMETPPWLMSRTPGSVRLPAPGYAEHNEYVFSDLLGLTALEIETLYKEGITTLSPDVKSHI
jgi:crotonobetainyl-CoA:carnitine CoA-transferase CaiB-like acyl-CoA transferase